MSAASSYEAYTLSNTEIAQQTDRRLLFVAQNLPPYAFKGANNEPIVVCQQLDVGELSCTNSGAQTVEVAVKLYGHAGQLGFWKEFGLPYGALARPGERVVPIDSGPSSSSEFEECPDTTTFLQGFDSLFKKFIAELTTEHGLPETIESPYQNVIQLADHRPA